MQKNVSQINFFCYTIPNGRRIARYHLVSATEDGFRSAKGNSVLRKKRWVPL